MSGLRVTKILAMPILLLSLASCSAFEGRETTGQYVDDATITTKVKEAFVGDPQVKAMQVNVETMQGVVQLSGFVDSTAAEQRAVSLAQDVKGVKSVKDNIIVRAHHRKSSSSDTQ
jgi:hyperosmotically inducible protein